MRKSSLINFVFKVYSTLGMSILIAALFSSCQKISPSPEASNSSNSKSAKSSSIPSEGLIAYWAFDGNGNDLSGNGNTAALTNLTSTTDRFGNLNGAFQFNGSSSYASVTDNPTLRLNNTDFTLNAWVKMDSYNSSYGSIILSKRVAGVNSGWTWSVTGAAGSPTGVASYGPGGGNTNAFGSTTVGLSSWHMVTSVYSLASGQLSIYIDGVLDNTTSGILTANGAITALLYIGKDNAAGGYYFQGAMDDIRMYNRRLSNAEIQQLYNINNIPPLSNGLIAYWAFNGDGNDISGHGHTATLTNLASTTDRMGNPNGAFYFNGSSSFASVADSADLRLNNTDFTLNAWVKMDSYNSSYGSIIMSKRTPGINSGWTWSITGATGNPTGVASYGPGGGNTNAFGSVPVGLSSWHMVTSVYNLASGQFSIYIDGVLDNTTSGILTANGAITAMLYIGKDDATSSYYFHGAMDDIKIYNRGLSSSEIQQLYNIDNIPSLSNGLLAYWTFDGNGKDLSGNTNTATLTNLTSTTDRLGNPNGAFYFNGSSSFASVTDKPALRLNNTDFTLNAWVKMDSYNSSYGSIIMSKRTAGINTGWTWSVTGAASSPIGVASYGPGGGNTNAFGSVPVGLSSWHMVTSVYNLTNGQFNIYIDGVLDNTTSGILTANGAITASLYIGKDNASGIYYFHGSMDDVRIYNRRLSSPEIQQLYKTIY